MATFGTTGTGATGFDNPADNVVWCKATSTPSDGTLDSISLIGRAKLGTPTVEAAIYSDNAGVAGTLLAQSAGTVSVTTINTYTINMPAQALTNGTQYWFALRVTNYGTGPDNDVEVAFDSVGGNELNYINGASFPGTGAGANVATERWSVYGTYTASGAGGGGAINVRPAKLNSLRPRAFAPGIAR